MIYEVKITKQARLDMRIIYEYIAEKRIRRYSAARQLKSNIFRKSLLKEAGIFLCPKGVDGSDRDLY